MIIGAVIVESEWPQVEQAIYKWCRVWGNPMEDEFLFYDPDPRLLTLFALYDIEYWPVEVG